MLDLSEAGIGPGSLDTSFESIGPCFEASVQRTEVSENILFLQFRWDVSGPLVQQNLPAKSDLENLSFNLVFSSDTSVYRFTGKPVSQTTGSMDLAGLVREGFEPMSSLRVGRR